MCKIYKSSHGKLSSTTYSSVSYLHCALAAAQCIIIGSVIRFVLIVCLCVCLWVVCVFVGLLPRLLEIACIDLHQIGFVGKGSDHLQLIKFWPSCAPGKGGCGGANFFGSALLQPARRVCVSLSAFFIICICYLLTTSPANAISNNKVSYRNQHLPKNCQGWGRGRSCISFLPSSLITM